MNKLFTKLLGLLIILFAVGATCVSTGLSIAYFSELTNDDTLSLVVTGFVVLLQSMVLLGSISKGIIYKKTPQHFYTVLWFTKICFIISVLSTITFFNGFEKSQREVVIEDLLTSIPYVNLQTNVWLVDNLTNLTLIWISCVVLDLMSMYFPAIGSDLISGISTHKKLEIQDRGYVMKVIKIITFYPKKYIDDLYKKLLCNESSLQEKSSLHSSLQKNKCNESSLQSSLHKNSSLHTSLQSSLQDETSLQSSLHNTSRNSLHKDISLQDENVMKDENIDTTGCNDRNDYSNESSLHKNTSLQDTSLHTSLQNSSLHNTSLQNSSLQELITKIDEFITENYKCNEKIKVKDIKEQFRLKQNDRRWNDKIRNNLKSCKVINGKLTKVENNKKLEVVK